MIGALDPLAFVGTTEHTNAKLKPFQRLSHTAEVFEAIFFGTRAEADKALALVHRLHERVEGEMPEDAGKVPAGTPYSAFDPELMLWTMAVIADSGPVLLRALRRSARRLRARASLAGVRALRRALRHAARRSALESPRVPRLVRRDARLGRDVSDRRR